jgi:hypothetical protein
MSPTGTTGLEVLDRVLGGLYWGDNVVWDVESAGDVDPFYAAVAAIAGEYDAAAYVTLTRDPDDLVAAHPGLEVLDARASGPLAAAAASRRVRQVVRTDRTAAASPRIARCDE